MVPAGWDGAVSKALHGQELVKVGMLCAEVGPGVEKQVQSQPTGCMISPSAFEDPWASSKALL